MNRTQIIARTWLRLFCLVVSLTLLSCENNHPYQTIGYVEANFIYLSAPFGGYLQQLTVNVGDLVQKGQLILKLNGSPQQEEVRGASAKWRAAKDNLDEIKRKDNKSSQHKIDAMQEEVNAASANLSSVQWAYNTKSITAPEVGVVSDIFFARGEYVPPSSPIVSLFVASKMRVIFYVPEINLNKIKINKQIVLSVFGKQYQAKIISIGKKAEFTPEAMFSEQNRHKLVYKITVEVPKDLQNILNAGQPVDIDYAS